VLYNFFGDRISDVGANERARHHRAGARHRSTWCSRSASAARPPPHLENLTDSDYSFTQGPRTQRLFRLGRTVALSFGYTSSRLDRLDDEEQTRNHATHQRMARRLRALAIGLLAVVPAAISADQAPP
jgi:hypothetical protein